MVLTINACMKHQRIQMNSNFFAPKLPSKDPDPTDPTHDPYPLPNPDEPGPEVYPEIDPPSDPIPQRFTAAICSIPHVRAYPALEA